MEIKDSIKMGVEVHRCDECEYKQNSAEWISGEILPPTDDDVLVWFEYFRYGDYNRLYQTMGIGSTFNGEWSGFVNGSSGWQKLKIIAWQPLPNPPKGAKNMSIGDNIKKYMKENGYTQKELAMRSDCTEAAISQYINNKRIPSIKVFNNLIIALGVSADDLLNERGGKNE